MVDILIVEDMTEIAGLLRDFLEAAGYTAATAQSGEEAMELYSREGARLVVLDIMLPGMDGFAVCRRIREDSGVPIIILSARVSKEDKLNGLILGADDYMEKPYDVDILLAKIDGIFRRRYATRKLQCGDLALDKDRRTVTKGGTPVPLSAKEFDLLLFLMENSGKALSKELLLARVWGADSFSEPQTLTVHIKWLRDKLEDDSKDPRHIITVWGVGYRFDE